MGHTMITNYQGRVVQDNKSTKSNIVLIGFMGVGKTTIGKVLADRLQRDFIELDLLIEKKTGKAVTDIFRDEGEIAFRDLEIQTLKEIADSENVIIDCGGGVVLNQINIDRLKKKARVAYLTASTAVLLKRLACDGDKRPLLAVPDKKTAIRTLLKIREPFYEFAADIKLNTSRLTINDAVDKLINKLRQDESFNL